jgi:hypothetical protein
MEILIMFVILLLKLYLIERRLNESFSIQIFSPKYMLYMVLIDIATTNYVMEEL